MRIPTVKKYKEAISDLTRWQLEVLQALYDCPSSAATGQFLSHKLVASNPRLFTATGSIGRVGKAIARYCPGVPKTPKKGYFALFVSPPYVRGVGYTMHKNLQTALEELGLVTKK